MEKHFKPFSGIPVLIAIGIFIVLAVGIKIQQSTIEAQPASISEKLFSADRAFLMLESIFPGNKPHPMGTPEIRELESGIVRLLREMGYEEEIQEADVCNDYSVGLANCARVRNIIVKIPGKNSGNTILLSAHYDSVPAGPGGSDAGAAVGSLLETARVLSLQKEHNNSIVILFNEGEEFGLLGARAFMEQHPLAKDINLAINIEARGSGGQSVMFETGEDSGWLVKHYAASTPKPWSNSLFYEVYKFLPNDTDLTIYKQHGLQGLNFAHAEREPHYHTPRDTLENLDKGSLQHHGDNLLGLVNNLSSDSGINQESGNLVFTDILNTFVIYWPENYSIWISNCIFLLIICSFVFFSNKAVLDLKQVAKGMLATLSIVLITTLSAFLIQKISQLISGNFEPWRADVMPMRVAILSSVVAITILSGRWFAKNTLPINFAFGVNFVWAFFAVISSLWLPGISYLFIIPCAIGLIVLLLFTVFSGRLTMNLISSGLIINSVVYALVLIPVVYILETMIGYQMAVAIGLISGILVSTLLPLLSIDNANDNGLKWFLRSLTVVIIISVSVVSFQAPNTEWMPQPLNIRYVKDLDNKDYVFTQPIRARLPSLMAKELGTIDRKALFPWSTRKHKSAEVETLSTSGMTLSVLEEVVSEDSRVVSLSVYDKLEDLAAFRLFIPVDSNLESIKVGENLLSYKDEKNVRNGFYEYMCRGMSCANEQLELSFHSKEQVSILLAKIKHELPVELETLANSRGNKSVPRHSGDQTIVISQFSL